MANPRFLRSADITKRLGISGKALRVYEAQGLLRADRSPAGWRVYGPDHIARLHQILALKSFGFSLNRIAELMAEGVSDLPDFLAMHEEVLHQEARRIERAIRLLTAARRELRQHGRLSSDDLMNLTKETTMIDRNEDLARTYEEAAAKHFTPQDRSILAGNGFQGMDIPDPEWAALHEEAAGLMYDVDPASPEAMDLARRWMTKVFSVTDGDPALTRKLRAVAQDVHADPEFAAASPSSTAMMTFVSEAYGAAITAGIMPRPADAA